MISYLRIRNGAVFSASKRIQIETSSLIATQSRYYSTADSLEPRLKAKLNDVVEGKNNVRYDQKPRVTRVQTRKQKAQRAQTLMDFGFVLRPYMKDYFSDIQNLLHNTPNFLEEREIVSSFLGMPTIYSMNNPYVITKVVENHLRNHRPAYAMHLCRMVKQDGTIGMNKLLSYLLKHQKFSIIFKVYNNMKKWGVPPSEITFTILSHAGVSADGNMAKSDIQTLYKIYDNAMKNVKSAGSKKIITNSTLVSLAKTGSPQSAYQFYEKIPKSGSFSRDEVTYSTMLNLISKLKNPNDYPDLLDTRKNIWREITYRVDNGEMKMSPKLADSYCNSLAVINSPECYKAVVELYQRYFTYGRDDRDDKSLRKFPFTESQLDIILKSCLRTENYSDAIKYYKKLNTMKNVKLDRSCVHNFLRNIASMENPNLEVAQDLFQKMISEFKSGNLNMKPTSLTIHLLWKCYLNSNLTFDINIADNTVKELCPDLQIPIDDIILNSYLEVYTQALKRNVPPSSIHTINAASFVSKNMSVLEDVSSIERNPLRIQKALTNMKTLSKHVLEDEINLNDVRQGRFKWLKNCQKTCISLLSKINQDLKKNPKYKNSKFDIQKMEDDIFHEKKQEILTRYERLIKYNEVYVPQPKMDRIKKRLERHAARKLVEPMEKPNPSELLDI